MKHDEYVAQREAKDPEFAAVRADLDPRFELARAMIDARAAVGLSQAAFAERLGMKQPQIARLESGEHPPRLETLMELAAASGAVRGRAGADDPISAPRRGRYDHRRPPPATPAWV